MQSRDLAGALNQVLRAEGYDSSLNVAAGGSVVLLALDGVDKLVVFAADENTIDHVQDWARTLDTRHQEEVRTAVFTYEVRNTQAEELTGTLNRMLAAGVAHARPAPPPRPGDARPPGAAQRDPAVRVRARRRLFIRHRGGFADRRRQEPEHAALSRLRPGVGGDPRGHREAGPVRSPRCSSKC